VEATQRAIEQLEADQDAALSQWRLAVERARYDAERAERQYRAVEPLCCDGVYVALHAGTPGHRIFSKFLRYINCWLV
jgi:hypothetical protein